MEGWPQGGSRHQLTLFTQHEMEAAFVAAGLTVERLPEVLRTRGLYVGRALPDPERT